MHSRITGTEENALLRVLEITRRLGGSFEVSELLGAVVDAALDLLSADRGTVFLYDAETDELYSSIATGEKQIRFSAKRGIAGECAQGREVINVPDCYSDPRFNPEVDRKTGYRTRCLLSIPLVSYDGALVGVLQVLNKMPDGVFNESDEQIALALAAQCAVAIKRAVQIEEHLIKEKLERDLALAREIQAGVLPTEMPVVPGYDVAGWSQSADETGGDIYDLIADETDGHLTVLMGDATGHGIGPALSVTQVRAMVRMSMRLGAGLTPMFTHVNNQLCDDLPANRFVTAFLGVLEPETHTVRYHAGGQGPLLVYRAAKNACEWLDASTFPMGIVSDTDFPEPDPIVLEPGDVLALISDGIYEYADAMGDQFGEPKTGEVVAANSTQPMAELIETIRAEVARFADGAPQNDDMTIVLIRRLP